MRKSTDLDLVGFLCGLAGVRCARHDIGLRCCRFATNAETFFLGCTQLPCEAPTPFLVRLLYMIEMGFYIQVQFKPPY